MDRLLRGGLTVELASAARPAHESASSARSLELAGPLRAAVMEGDEARIARLLGDLLRVTGLTKGQRVRLQLRVLLKVVHALRSAALNDELTGLHNYRGFVQIGTRLLDVAARDEQCAYLVYFRLEPATVIREAGAQSAADLLIRQMGNFMRDLFPSYGVYEVLGRLSAHDFAALTLNAEYATCSAIRVRTRSGVAGLPLEVGIARFNPTSPVPIGELLQSAARAVRVLETAPRIASSGPAPQPRMTPTDGLEAVQHCHGPPPPRPPLFRAPRALR